MTAILVAEGLHKTFGAVVAAAGINLAFNGSAVVSLIGANGAGKTTFLNMVTGYLRPDAGRISFGGQSVVGLSPRAIARLGISRSFQIPQLFTSLTVRENLMVAAGIARAGGQAEVMLDRFGLGAYAGRSAALLPEGVRKLLDVAMALVGRPKLLLLDEPTSGVAADEKLAVMDLVMAAANAAGVLVLFVEHDMEIVARYAQRVVAFYDGRVIADGAPGAVLESADVRRYVIGEVASHAAT